MVDCIFFYSKLLTYYFQSKYKVLKLELRSQIILKIKNEKFSKNLIKI